MAYPVKITVLDGSLGLQPGSNQQTIAVMGCCLGNNAGGGVVNTIYNFGDPVTATNSLMGGELLELVQYILKAAPGSLVQAMPLNPTTRGGVGAVTKVGAGAMTVTPTLAPQGAVTVTCTTAGALGTAAFTFGVTNAVTGATVTSAPVLSTAAWSSSGYVVPGTFTTLTFTAGAYVTGAAGTADVYIVSILGAVTHPFGAGPVVPTFASSPVDSYPSVVVTVVTAGAVGASQVTYSLDGGFAVSSNITTSAAYAIPGTGIVLTFVGAANVGDTYTFQTAAPTFTTGDFTAANSAIQSTLINSFFASQIGVVGAVASAAAWATLVASAESQAVGFNVVNVFPRYHVGGPTLGTVLPSNGNIVVDTGDTDAIVIAARAGMAAPHVDAAAGDGYLISPMTGLRFRRNAVWGAIARAAKVVASQDIGAYADGGLTGFGAPVRDDFANALTFFNSGITSLQTYGAGSPTFINRGFMATTSTSDYFTLTNCRVIDQASTIAVNATKQYILAKIPTQTRNGITGTIREDYARRIESAVGAALSNGLLIGQGISVANAVAASCVVTRTNSIYSSGQLLVTVAVQPFGYPSLVQVSIGMTLSAS